MNEVEYTAALERIHVLMHGDPEKESEDGVELLKLVDEVEAYERVHFPEFFTQRGIALSEVDDE